MTMGDNKQMTLDLKLIRNKVKPYLIKSKGLFSDDYYELTPDEEFFMEQMAPACHSLYIANDYVLNCNITFGGCKCCS